VTAALIDPTVQLLPPKLEAAAQEFGIYGVEFLPLPAAASPPRSTQVFEVDEDHAFLIVAANVSYLSNANAVIGPADGTPIPALVTMGLQGAARQIIQQTIPRANDSPIDNWFGTGKQWCYWPMPVIVPPGRAWVVQMTNLEAVTRNFRLSFIGARLWRSRVVDPWGWCRDGW
jgi:hypothetical protein